MQTPGVERMLRTRGRRSVIRVCRLTVRLYPSPGRIGSDDVPVLNPQQHRDISLYGSRPVAGGVFLAGVARRADSRTVPLVIRRFPEGSGK